jgi:hypothetical protein
LLGIRYVTGANRPPGWNRWSAAEKVAHLLGMSLDHMAEYLSWPAEGLDPYRLAAQTQAIRVVAMVAAKAGMRQVDHEAIEQFRQAIRAGIERAWEASTGKTRPAAGGWPRKIVCFPVSGSGSHHRL